MTFGTYIKDIRVKNKLSASKFGRRIGVEGGTVYVWESDKGYPSAQALRSISDEFGIEPATLLNLIPSINTTNDGVAA